LQIAGFRGYLQLSDGELFYIANLEYYGVERIPGI